MWLAGVSWRRQDLVQKVEARLTESTIPGVNATDSVSSAGAGASGGGVREPLIRRVSVAGGVNLAVRVWEPPAGSTARAPFVLLHGMAATAAGWDGVARRLADAGRVVYALDFRGHGESDRPETGYDLATYGSDLAAALGGLGLEAPILVGHSLGAWVILEAGAGERLTPGGVCLVEGGLVDACDQFTSLEEALAKLALPPVAGMPLARLAGYLRHSNPAWPDERLAAALSAFDVAADGTVSWRLTGPRLDALVRAMWEARVGERWPELRTPGAVVVADTGDAAWTSAKRKAEADLRRVVPGLRFEWMTADHEVQLDRPEAVAKVLLDVFAGI